MEGTAGEEVPSTGSYPNFGHNGFLNKCADCHFDTGTTGVLPTHDFQPKVATCRECHPGLASTNRPAVGDYDGSGFAGGIQDEVSGLLDALKAAILAADARVTFDGQGFLRDGIPGLPGATVALQRGAYNWEVVFKDGSRGIHNAPRAVALLQRSYKEITGGAVTGAILR